jgi:hypothetical protein
VAASPRAPSSASSAADSAVLAAAQAAVLSHDRIVAAQRDATDAAIQSVNNVGSGLLGDDVLGDEKLTLQICIAGVKAAVAEGKLERAALYSRKAL